MPVKLFINLRCLQPSLPVASFCTMKPNPLTVYSSRVVPVFSRMFPHRLKYQSLGSLNSLSSIRKLSTRSGRDRTGPVSGLEVRASKSLVEDEAELSDWVSGLSTKNSFKKTQLYSDSDKNDDNENESDGYGYGKGGGGGRGRGRGGGRGREESRGGGRRESSFEEFNGSGRRGGARGPVESHSRRRDSSFEGFSGSGGRGGARGSGRRGGGRGPVESHSRRRDSSFEEFGGSGRRGGTRGSVESDLRRRENGGRDVGSRERFSGGMRGKGRFGGEMAGRREERRGERGSESRNGMDRGGGRGMRKVDRGDRRRGLIMSDEDGVDKEQNEDEEEKGFRSFKELIGSDEDSEEVDDEDSDELDDDEEKEGDDVFNRGSVLRESSPGSTESSDSYLSETRFDQFSISPLSMKGLKDAGYEKMTVVQEATFPVILKGKDVMAKARTGTGKTVAFLLPSIEVVVKTPPASRDEKRPPIFVLVVCPTRELACQAAAEANKLLKYHPSIGVQVVIGGTRLALEQKRMQANPCQILVATPGRLKDHIENTAGFATRLMGVKVLVLDEADHLLDMGFRRDIEKIIAAVPKQRQTLLFSATIPQEVRQICHIALKRDHEYINKVQEGSEETHTQVRQMHLIASLDNHFPLLYALLKEHIADNVDYKVLVFCTTAMVTRLVAELLGELNLNVREIHSRKSQSYRTRVSDEFRKSKGLILVTSDVSARGVDYPDVTLVIQIGVPADRQQYIHRLGRTGRKGKEGQGILLLAPWEEFFLSNIKELPITKAPVPSVDPETQKKVERALSQVGMKDKESAYQAWLGYYNSSKDVGKDKYRLVELANEFSRTMGLDNPPAISKQILGKMGLRNIPGLRSK